MPEFTLKGGWFAYSMKITQLAHLTRVFDSHLGGVLFIENLINNLQTTLSHERTIGA